MNKKTLRNIYALAASFSLAAPCLVSCQYSQLPNYNTQQPTISDLTGTWEATEESLTDMKERGGYPISSHELILRADGTFSMLNMPDCVFTENSDGWGASHQKLKSGKGTWKISSFQHEGATVWDVGFLFDNKRLGTLTSGPGPILIKRNRTFLLHFSFGDADLGHAVEFFKKH